jgi:hypothetical protein
MIDSGRSKGAPGGPSDPDHVKGRLLVLALVLLRCWAFVRLVLPAGAYLAMI